jgi:hypothetical protein
VRTTRWLIFAPVALLALFGTVTHAEPIAGLNIVGYIVTDIPPIKSTTLYEECVTELDNNINRSFDGEPLDGCPDDGFMVHYFGSIIIPAHDTIQFWLASDDGGTIKIGTDEWGSWQDQGCSATESGFLDLDAGIHSLDGWFYEAGGSTCWMLAWQIDDEPWQIVPDEAFIANGESWTTTTVQTTTTTSVPETTVVDTSIALVETSTSTSISTTVPITTVPITTTTNTTTTSVVSTTSVTVEQTTTTTEPEPQPVQQQPVWVEPEPIAEPATEDTEPIPVVTEPVEEVTVETYPDFPEIIDEVIDEVVDETIVEEIIPEDVVFEDTVPDEVVTEDTVADIFSDEELETILEDVETITVEEAVAVAQDEQFVESLSESQAVAVFDAIVVSELSTQEIEAIVEAVQDAPAEVRSAFEQEINIFAEGFDEYVPLGSTVPVGTRRTLIAVAAGTAIVAAGQRRYSN